MSDEVAAIGGVAAGADGGDVASVTLDEAANTAPSLPLLPAPLDSELTADDLEILCTLPDNDTDDAAASSVETSALPTSPEPLQAAAAESSPLLLGQELSSEMSGASDPWLPTPSPHDEIGTDTAEASAAAPASVEDDRVHDSLSTPSPSPHNDHSYTAPASPADGTADEGEDVGGSRENVSTKNVDGQEIVGDEGGNAGSDRDQKPQPSDLLLRDVGEGKAAHAADGDDTQPNVNDDVPPVALDGLAKGIEVTPSASAEATAASRIIAMEVDDDDSGAVVAVPQGSAPDHVVASEPAGGRVALELDVVDCGELTSPNLSGSADTTEGSNLANRREAGEGGLAIGDGPSTRTSGRVGVSTRRTASGDLRSGTASVADGRSPASAAMVELKKTDDLFACDQCSRSFPRLVNLRRHVANAHDKPWLKGNPPSSRQGADSNETVGDGTESRLVRCVCCSCRRSFRSLIDLRVHRKSCGATVGRLVPSSGPTACGKCGRRCVSAIALRRHLQSHRSQSRSKRHRAPISSLASSSRSSSKPRPASIVSKARAGASATAATTAGAPAAFECRRCGDSLPDMKSFIVHMETHSSEPAPYECSPTEESSGSGDRDADDQVTKGAAASVEGASSAIHLCDQCGRTFRRLDRLQLHMKCHEEASEAAADDDDDESIGDSSGPRLCDKCGKEVSSAELLELHIATAHGDDDDEDKDKAKSGDADSSSPACAIKIIVPEQHLDAKQNGDGVRQPSLGCTSCSDRFATELELKRHLLKHRPSSSTTVPASVRGGDKHSDSKTLTIGLRPGVRQPALAKDGGGRGEKQRRERRQCRRCGRHFARGCSLRRHELAEHVGIADGRLGLLPTCHKCGRQFRARQRLREHLASVHSRPQPSCSVCGLRFTSAARLCWHVERRHGDAAEERRPQQRRFGSFRSSSAASGSASRLLQQRMYRCRHCMARFRHAQQLWLHSLRRHSPDIVRTGLGVVRGLEICGKAGKTLPLHRITMWHSCLHCMARYRQLESLWRHTRLSHRDRLLDTDGAPLLPAREPKALQGDESAGGGGECSGNLAKLGSPSARSSGSSGARKLPIVTASAPVHTAFVSTAEQSKQLIARNFKIAPGGREPLAVQQKPQTAASNDPTPFGGRGSTNATEITENRRYNHRDQQRTSGIRCDQTTLNKPIGEMQRRADATKSAALGGSAVDSRPASARATRGGDSVGSSTLANRRPVAGGGAGAVASQQQEQEESQYYSAAGRALRRSVLQRAAKAADGDKSAGTRGASSSTAAHSGSDSTESSPGAGGSKPTLSTHATTAAVRRPVAATVMPTLRQQAMCLWCDATFPRLAMLAEHACVHRDELQKIILETIGKRT